MAQEEVERRPVCILCHQEVALWDWGLKPLVVKKQVALVVVCHPRCKTGASSDGSPWP